MKMLRPYFCVSVLAVPFGLLAGCPTNPPPGDGDSCSPQADGGATTVSYANDIVPILTAGNCLTSACHGGTIPSGDYDMRTYQSLFVAGESARELDVCEIVRGDPESSFLFEKISSNNPRRGLPMPQEREPLTDAEIALIETWIREGAQDN